MPIDSQKELDTVRAYLAHRLELWNAVSRPEKIAAINRVRARRAAEAAQEEDHEVAA
jgi:hypothetical protein